MDTRRGLLARLVETVDEYRAERRAAAPNGDAPQRGGWLRRHGWQMILNLGTLLLVAVLLVTVPSLAAPKGAPEATSTSTISYQGRLTDSAGNPLTGYYEMRFRIYDSPSATEPLWTEEWDAENSVSVSDGLFNVMLGSISPGLPAAIIGHDELYLGIQVGQDDEMVPRVQLGSVPYAMYAALANVPDGSITTAKLAPGAATQYQAVLGELGAECSSTEWVDMPGRTVTLTTEGGPVLVLFSASHTPEANTGVVGYWRIVRDGTVVLAYNNHSFVQWLWTTTTLLGLDAPPAGSHTYKVQWRVSQGTLWVSEGAYTANFTAVEFKR